MSRAAPLEDTDPITLTEASELVLRGAVTVSALRAEIRRGNLRVAKIGKNLFTTPHDIREMWNRCLVSQPRPASTSGQTTEPGLSGTKVQSDELAAVRAIGLALKNGSLSTSPKSTQADQRGAANPIQFPLRK